MRGKLEGVKEVAKLLSPCLKRIFTKEEEKAMLEFELWNNLILFFDEILEVEKLRSDKPLEE